MRVFYYFLILFFVSEQTNAQHYFDKTESIAEMERDRAARLFDNIAHATFAASDNVDVKYYRCKWEIDPAVKFIAGEVTVYFSVLSTLDFLSLDLNNSLTTDSVKQRNNLLSFERPTNELKINFPQALTAGSLDSVTIFYRGVPDNSGFGSFITATHGNNVPVAWSLSEPYGSRDWWPCKSNLGDKADSIDIYIIHPSQYKAASNGLLQSETLLSGDTTTSTHWKHRYPITSYLVCFAVTNYVVFNDSVLLGTTNLPMQTHCYPESLNDFKTNTFQVLDAMKVFYDYFGDYPFAKEKYGHVQFGWGGGMEHQTSTFIVNTSRNLMAHELGHQWFGNKLTTRSWSEIWLNEGFATFTDLIYNEKMFPEVIIARRKADISIITDLPGGSVFVADTTDVNRIFSSRYSYRKGGYIINMLRLILGEDKFIKGVRNYLNDPKLAYAFTTTEDLKRNLEAASGKNLTSYFEKWYKREGFPSYKIEWSQFDTNWVNINIKQTTSTPASVSFFDLPVPLLFKNATNSKTIVLNNTINNQNFFERLGFVPDSVLFDPESWLISRNNSVQKVSFQNTGEESIDIFPNPVQQNIPLTIFLQNFNANTGTINIYNMMGQKLHSNKFNITSGAFYYEYPTGSLSKGIYNVQVIVNNKMQVKRIMKL